MLNSLDLGVIGFYFLLVFGVAAWATFREKSQNLSDDYFLGGRNLGWFVIGASLFASNIGSEHLIGLAGSGFNNGVPEAQYEILAGLILLILGWVFVPFYIKSGVATMPEFLEKRFSPAARGYLSWVSILSYVLTKISVTILAGGVVFEVIGLNFWIGAIVLVIATGIYTIFGGLKAVVYTDMIQMFVLLFGSLAVTWFGLESLGGTDQLFAALEDTETFNLWKAADHPDFPWTGMLFGAPILGVWYWCTDQFIVQRVLSAKNMDNARKGTIFAGYLKMLPLFLFVVPGIVAAALVAKGQLEITDSNKTLPILVQAVLPHGLIGLVVAGLFAALMSSLSSVFNSSSTLITLDIYKKYKPKATERELVIAGQLAVVVLVVFGMLWTTVIKLYSTGLFSYIQKIQAYISPPIAAVFLLGLFFRRLNAKGAMASFIVGFVLGAARLAMEPFKDDLGGIFHYYVDVNFLHFAIFLFLVCSVVLVVVSLLTPAQPLAQIEELTYGSKSEANTQPTNKSNVVLSLLLVVIVLILWYIMSPAFL